MHFNLEPGRGAEPLMFGMNRDEIRTLLQSQPMTKSQEPENDFYENEGLIPGYDEEDRLEFIEITKSSTAEFRGVDFFSRRLEESIEEMKHFGYEAPCQDGGYDFEAVGIALYCPQGVPESVSLYKEGYYE